MSQAPLVISASAAAASALAAWRSSFIAARSAIRANLPYVWPAVRPQYEEGRIVVWVRLHNDGPGLAQDVVVARQEPSWDGRNWETFDRTLTIPTLRSGETLPPDGHEELSLGTHTAGDDIFSVVVRWTDTAGQRVELVAPQDPHQLTRPPRKLRRGKLDRWRPDASW